MLTPARSATALVVNPASPWLSRMRAAASRMMRTVSSDRAWRGILRGLVRIGVAGAVMAGGGGGTRGSGRTFRGHTITQGEKAMASAQSNEAPFKPAVTVFMLVKTLPEWLSLPADLRSQQL